MTRYSGFPPTKLEFPLYIKREKAIRKKKETKKKGINRSRIIKSALCLATLSLVMVAIICWTTENESLHPPHCLCSHIARDVN